MEFSRLMNFVYFVVIDQKYLIGANSDSYSRHLREVLFDNYGKVDEKGVECIANLVYYNERAQYILELNDVMIPELYSIVVEAICEYMMD